MGDKRRITIDLSEDADEPRVLSTTRTSNHAPVDRRQPAKDSRQPAKDSRQPAPAAKRAGQAACNTIDLSEADDDAGLIIDLSEDDKGTSEPGDFAIDLTADDTTLAKQMQKAFNAAAAAAVDLTASDDDEFDLLLAYRTGVDRFLRDTSPNFRVREIFHNPHSLPGTPLYERFFSCFKRCRDKTIKLVFHGTSEENVDAICRSSLDPQKRGKNGQALGKGEYFAEDLLISLPYCQGGRKLLVFAVIMDESGLRKHNTPGVLVCHRPDHHLPIAVITLEKNSFMLSLSQTNPLALLSQIRAGQSTNIPSALLANMSSSLASHVMALMGGSAFGGGPSMPMGGLMPAPAPSMPRPPASSSHRKRRR